MSKRLRSKVSPTASPDTVTDDSGLWDVRCVRTPVEAIRNAGSRDLIEYAERPEFS